MMMPKPSLFAEEERGNRRAKMGGPLMGLSEHVDFIALAAGTDTASPRPSRAKGGRTPYLTALMIKILVLVNRRYAGQCFLMMPASLSKAGAICSLGTQA